MASEHMTITVNGIPNCSHPNEQTNVGPTTTQINHFCPDCSQHWTTFPAPQAVVGEASEDPYFGVQDEVYLTRAVSVMNDVLTDISGWEDKALAEAVESSKADLCAMIECIRMRADGSYVPGSKPIDGEFA